MSAVFFLMTADQVLVFDWIAGSTHINSPKHKRGFILRAFCGSTRQYYVNYSSYTVNAFRVQVENGLENVLFLHFSLVSIQFDVSWLLWSTLATTQLFKSGIGGI